MSIVYCHYCIKEIDTDFDADHFIPNTEDCVLEAKYNKDLTNDLGDLFRNLNEPLK